MPHSEDTTIKTFEFRLRANKNFVEACERELEHSRQIYNAALAEQISCYQITGASLGYIELHIRLDFSFDSQLKNILFPYYQLLKQFRLRRPDV